MLPEVQNNRNVGNLLRGASIILSVEPTVQLSEALVRSRTAEGRSEDDLNEAIDLIAKVANELKLNGGETLSREHSRAVLRHILKNPPWRYGGDKNELP